MVGTFKMLHYFSADINPCLICGCIFVVECHCYTIIRVPPYFSPFTHGFTFLSFLFFPVIHLSIIFQSLVSTLFSFHYKYLFVSITRQVVLVDF